MDGRVADHRLAELVGEVALRMKADLAELNHRVNAMCLEVIPEFQHDEAAQRMMMASTAGNINSLVDALQLGILLDDIPVPPAAAQYARQFAQRGLALESVLRAYRRGEQILVQWVMCDLDRSGLTVSEALAVTSRVAAISSGYVDQVISELPKIYQSERRRWEQRSGAARAAQIRAVLADSSISTDAAEEMVGQPMRGWHVGAVAWVDGADGSGLRGVDRLLAEASGGAPMTMSADSATVWGWLRFPTQPELDTPALASALAGHPGLHLALGEPGHGLEGFRTSHAEALRARQVAEVAAHPGRRLHEHTRLALAGLLVDRRDIAHAWVLRVLGDLAGPDERLAQLRETVRTFLDTNGSYTDTAARMHMHKNSVLYRVRKAEEILGRPVTEGRLSIEVALAVCDELALTGGADRG